MGQLTFLLPASVPPAAGRCLGLARLAGGYDRVPIPARRTLDGSRLAFEKVSNDSAYLRCPWPVPGAGHPVFVSATLRDRIEPYHFPTELARGKLNQVRTQLAEWEGAGLELSDEDRAGLTAAVQAFGRAVRDPGTPAADAAAEEALAAGLRLGDRFTALFTGLLLNHRVTESGPPTTRLGARVFREPTIPEGAAYAAAFNAVRLVPDWRTIEPAEARADWTGFDAAVDWAVGAGLAVSGGPLVDIAAGPFPNWVKDHAGDLPSLTAFLCDYVETVVSRYRGRVSDWLVFSGFNHADALGLGEDDRLRLAARLVEAARSVVPGGTYTVGLSQVWGDYLAGDDDLSYSPLMFADTLLRGGLQIGGLELELVCGDGPRASKPRSLLDVYALLDLYAMLGVPLDIALSCPGGGDWACPPGWAAGVLDLAASIGQVNGVYWDSWADGDATRVPGAPLWAGEKPAGGPLSEFQRVRREVLG